jgi:hypothetical protein
VSGRAPNETRLGIMCTHMDHQGAPSSASSTSPSPGLSTHNTKRANYHVKDISEFARTLEIVRPVCRVTREVARLTLP